MDPQAMLEGLAGAMDQMADGNPLVMAGRIAGFGAAEMRAGVPKWAWFLGGVVVGGSLMVAFGGPVRKLFGKAG